MLLDYIRAAQEGPADRESLDETIDTLKEVRRYLQAGKLIVRDEKALAEIRRSIAEYTNALAGNVAARPVPAAEKSGRDEFGMILDLLKLQKSLCPS